MILVTVPMVGVEGSCLVGSRVKREVLLENAGNGCEMGTSIDSQD